jgi:lysophospholipase L1-like esterase
MNTAETTAGPLRAGIIVIGVLTAAAAGGLALFTIGETYAIITAAIIVVTSLIIAFTASVILGRVVLVLLVLTLAGTLLTGAFGAIQILAALAGDQSGPVDPPDPEVLASAERKIDQSSEESTFQVTLSESELNAVLQDSLAETDTPFQRIAVDIINSVGEPALIGFVGDFKNGRLTVTGELTAQTSGGQLQLELLNAEVGMFTMPGVARDAVEDMIGRVADLNRALADEGADVQSVVIGDDNIVVTGVTSGGTPVDAGVMLAAFGDLGSLGSAPVTAPVYEPGADAATAPGNPVYMALGDSLAATVGVDGFAEGYVSQVHRELSLRDGIVYGLRNFGITGETSGTMLLGGQLADAVEYGSDLEVAYITIDVGANDLLGHLASSDCSEDVQAPECASRIDVSLNAYRTNIEAIFDTLDKEFPDATIVFLLAYNPFSLGFEDQVAFEAQSNEVLTDLNDIAAKSAADHGILVADGFSPMRGTTTATTHMTDTPPDIHPNARGYDVLTDAILSVLR